MKKSDGNICARVTSTQLRMPFFNLEPEKKKYTLPYSNVAAGLMLVAALTAGHPANAKTPKVETEIVQTFASNIETEDNHTESKPNNSESNDFTTLKGKVVVGNYPVENAKITLFTVNKILSTYSSEDGTFSLKIPNHLIDDANVIKASYHECRLKRFEEKDYVLTREDIKSDYNISAKSVEFNNGGIGSQYRRYDPIAIYNGEEIDYEEFVDAYEGKKNSCNLENKEFFYFDSEAAVAIYGEEAEHGLYILTEKPTK